MGGVITQGNRDNMQNTAQAFRQQQLESPVDFSGAPYFRPYEPPIPYNSRAVLNNVERWGDVVGPTVRSAPQNEGSKVRSVLNLLLGEAAQYALNFRRDGGHTVEFVMDTLIEQYRSRETAAQIRSRLLSTKRRPGQTLTSFKNHLEAIIRDIIRRDATYDDSCARDLYRIILDQLPDTLRCRLEDRYRYEDIPAMVAEIHQHAHRCPDRSPFSEKNLAREKENKRLYKNGADQKAYPKQTYQLALEGPKQTSEGPADKAPDGDPKGVTIKDWSELTHDEKQAYQITNKDNTCHKCQRVGHFARDCLSGGQVKQTLPGGTENKSNNNPSKSYNSPSKFKNDKKFQKPNNKNVAFKKEKRFY